MTALNLLNLLFCILLLSTLSLLPSFARAENGKEPVPAEECDKSLFTRTDLQNLIDLIYDESKIQKSIEDNIHSEAVDMRDGHIARINAFVESYRRQPEQLVQLLNRLAKQREGLEAAVIKVDKYVKAYPVLEASYQTQYNKSEQLYQKYLDIKKICDENCIPRMRTPMPQNSSDEEVYCGDFNIIYSTVSESTFFVMKNITNKMRNHIKLDNEKYKSKVNGFMQALKEKYAKKFGRAMADIVTLEDELNRYEEILNNTKIENTVVRIKTTSLLVEKRLIEFNAALNDYKRRCLECSNDPVLRSVRETSNKKIKINDHLLEELSIKRENKLLADIEKYYLDLIKPIDKTIEDVERKGFPEHEKLHSDIVERIQKEENLMVKFKSQVPEETLNNLNLLLLNLHKLLLNIDQMIDRIPK